MPDDASLPTAMATLYAVPPEEFVRTRTALVAKAKSAGEAEVAKQVGGLRRPSVAAWALNTVARLDRDVLGELLAVGERLREAQSGGDMATLQGLRPERDAAVDAYVRAAVRRAQDYGRALSSGVQQEVRDTAVAAIADAAAAEAAASGHLVTALSYSGFGEVDVSEALARTGVGSVVGEAAGETAPASSSAGAAAAEATGAEPSSAEEAAGTTGAEHSSAKRSSPQEAAAPRRAEATERAARKQAERQARAERVAAARSALREAEDELERAEELLGDARRTHREAVRQHEAAEQALRTAERS